MLVFCCQGLQANSVSRQETTETAKKNKQAFASNTNKQAFEWNTNKNTVNFLALANYSFLCRL